METSGRDAQRSRAGSPAAASEEEDAVSNSTGELELVTKIGFNRLPQFRTAIANANGLPPNLREGLEALLDVPATLTSALGDVLVQPSGLATAGSTQGSAHGSGTHHQVQAKETRASSSHCPSREASPSSGRSSCSSRSRRPAAASREAPQQPQPRAPRQEEEEARDDFPLRPASGGEDATSFRSSGRCPLSERGRISHNLGGSPPTPPLSPSTPASSSRSGQPPRPPTAGSAAGGASPPSRGHAAEVCASPSRSRSVAAALGKPATAPGSSREGVALPRRRISEERRGRASSACASLRPHPGLADEPDWLLQVPAVDNSRSSSTLGSSRPPGRRISEERRARAAAAEANAVAEGRASEGPVQMASTTEERETWRRKARDTPATEDSLLRLMEAASSGGSREASGHALGASGPCEVPTPDRGSLPLRSCSLSHVTS